MATYLVIHEPKGEEAEKPSEPRPPTRLEEMARDLSTPSSEPRWLKTWSPDLHDDRLFSLWEAIDAAAIHKAIEDYGFLDDFTAHPLRVQEWGPETVLAHHD
jgi:hypothetical protein